MKRTIVSLLLLTFITAGSALSAQGVDKDPDLEKLYQQIDDAIDHSPQYVAKRLGQIDDSRKMLSEENDLEKQFALAEQLFALYMPYRNDSALYFANLCVTLADSLQRKDMVGLYRSQMARQCSNAGMYVESLDLLKQVDRQALDREGLTKYYWAWMHICGEIGSYSQLEENRKKYFALQDSARKLFQDALALSENWLGKVADGTHENAYAAFYRSMVYEKLGNNRLVRYWLGKSALNDIKSAVNDQASLFMLAERLCEDGDYDRAYRYVRFCEKCNTAFSPQLRNYQERYVDRVMQAVYQAANDRYSRLLTIACVGALLLIGVVVWLLWKRKRTIVAPTTDDYEVGHLDAIRQ